MTHPLSRPAPALILLAALGWAGAAPAQDVPAPDATPDAAPEAPACSSPLRAARSS
jgi:hypothetical protein